VGLLPRLAGSLFDLSLLVRGRVPGGTTAAAEIQYRGMREEDARYVYYGRVVRDGGYIVLSYHFFFPMNQWRSIYQGANDHEADWEGVMVFLSEEPGGEPVPRWVAYASHDFEGEDLRLRWDDRQLMRAGSHPMVFAGAGSHASYYQPGEYIMGVEPSALRPVRRALTALKHFWRVTLRQGDEGGASDDRVIALRIPFVDYARGDGLTIGPGQMEEWTPILLTDDTAWAQRYRGLWGLDTRDRLGGERAPSGPKFNRDGSIRKSWYDPLGWAGLDMIPPPGLVRAQLTNGLSALTAEREALRLTIDKQRETVRLLARELESLHGVDPSGHMYQARSGALDEKRSELQRLQKRMAEVGDALETTQASLANFAQGSEITVFAAEGHHLLPEPPLMRHSRLADLWAAVSGGALILAFVALILWNRADWLLWVSIIAVLFFGVEATMRRRLASYLLNLTIVLALVTTFFLVKDFWRPLIITAVLLLPAAMIIDNLRELRAG
jgi:hypothetical protein